MITKKEFVEIFKDEETTWDGDNAFQGLLIIKKYFDIYKTDIITGASHDEIFSVDVDVLIESGITKEDAKRLRKLNWMYGEYCNCLSCFV